VSHKAVSVPQYYSKVLHQTHKVRNARPLKHTYIRWAW